MNTSQTRTLFFYQGARLITMKHGEQSCTVLRSEDQALAELHEETGAREARLISSDIQGSVLNRGAGGNPLTVSYTPYGYTPEDTKRLLSYTGERQETTGLYLLGNGYRGYAPVLMRFNSPDNYSPFSAGGLNAYVYCASDPINHSDPSGHIRLRSNSLPTVKPARIFSQATTQVSPAPMRRRVSAGDLSTRPNDFDSINEPDVRALIFNQLPGKDLGRLSTTSKSFQSEIESLSAYNADTIHHPHDVRKASQGKWPGVLPKDVTYKRLTTVELTHEINQISQLRAPDNETGVGQTYLRIRRSALQADRYYRETGIREYDPLTGRRNAIRLDYR